MRNNALMGASPHRLTRLPRSLLLASATLVLFACGGGGGQPAQPVSPTPPKTETSSSTATISSSSGAVASSSQATAETVQLQGRVTFDWVAPGISGNSIFLDYGNLQVRPARAVTVQLLDSLNNPIATTRTNSNGEYQFSVEANRSVKVRVKASLDADNYAIAVKDNTSSDAEYVLDGSLAGSGTSEGLRR